MPSVTLQISVSRRESRRARLLQLTAYDAAGKRLEGVALTVSTDGEGTLDGDAVLTRREIAGGSHGLSYFQWWPRSGDGVPRDFTSTVTVTCAEEGVVLFLDDLYE